MQQKEFLKQLHFNTLDKVQKALGFVKEEEGKVYQKYIQEYTILYNSLFNEENSYPTFH